MGSRGAFALACVAFAGCGDNIHPGGGTLLVSPQLDLRTTEAGGTATFTVALTNEPATDVVVELTSTNTSEGTVGPSTLTFNRDDYDQPRTVTITGVDDARADGDETFLVRVEAPRIGAVDLDVTNMDDDAAGFAITPLFGLMTTEGGTTASFDVRLTSEPAGDVMVPVSSSNPGEGTPDRTSLVFTPDDWETAKTVVVTGQQDAIADGSRTYTIVLGAASSNDQGYHGLDPDDVAVLNVDDDISGVAVNAGTLATTEAGAQDSFTVVLQTQPTADVTIDLASSDTTEATVSAAQLVFTSANWDQPQTVTVTGAGDFVDDGDQPFTITLAAASSTDAAYDGVDAADPAGTNADDDTAGFIVMPVSGLVTTEQGGTDAFSVELTSEPTAAVTIGVASTAPGEGTASVTMLTFTAADWDQPQTVTITGVDDVVSDGDQPYTVVLGTAVSTDTVYAGMIPHAVSVTNTDDDTAAITVDPVDGLFVSEFGDADTFTLVLNTAPTANVTIVVTSSDVTEGTVQPSSVTFTPANWNIPQTVIVTGEDDGLSDGNQLFSVVTAPATSADPAYNGVDAADVSVTNIDDDTAQVYVKARKRMQVSENGMSATFRVRLTVAPTATVTCTLSSTDTSEGLVSPTTLMFTTNQFGFQTVTVTGVDDQNNDGDVLFTIELDACSSADPQYNGSNPRDVSVINRDND